MVSLARSGAEAQTGQRDIDPARVAESCSQRSHRGRCADAPSWREIGKVRLGCDVGEGVGRSQSVIVVRDDLGVLEIFANQFESKAETAHAICGLVFRQSSIDRFLKLEVLGIQEIPASAARQLKMDGTLAQKWQIGLEGMSIVKYRTGSELDERTLYFSMRQAR